MLKWYKCTHCHRWFLSDVAVCTMCGMEAKR